MALKRMAIVIFTILMLSSFMVTVASAATAITVGSIWADSQLNDPNQLYKISQAYVGQRVYIYWDTVNPTSGTVDITVETYDQYGDYVSTITVGTSLTPSQSGTTEASFVVPNVPGGVCYVGLNGRSTRIQVASVSIFVLPESSLGALALLGASFGAFGAIGVVKYRRAKL
jgi:hypothetical protein